MREREKKKKSVRKRNTKINKSAGKLRFQGKTKNKSKAQRKDGKEAEGGLGGVDKWERGLNEDRGKGSKRKTSPEEAGSNPSPASHKR